MSITCQQQYLYKGAVSVESVEVIVEDGFTNDIQGKLAKARLHINWLLGLGSCL